jgi:photosystem II stability/assembly factor-like uncharacterized protein
METATETTRPTATANIPTKETIPGPTLTFVPAASPRLPSGSPLQLDEIHMVSLSEGWAISAGLVLRTSDGGKTWREVTPPEKIAAGTTAQVYGAFLNTQYAWVVFSANNQIVPEASVWVTTDGGTGWTQSAPLLHQVFGDSMWVEFSVLDTNNVWVMVRAVYAGAGIHFSHELFHSRDGGLNWTTLDGEISDDYTGMVFADPQFGLRTLQHTGAYENWAASYDVTTDGGANWLNRELPAPPGSPDLYNQYLYCETYQPNMLSAQLIRLLVGCFDAYDPPRQFRSYIYISQDGGMSWKTILLPEKVLASADRLFFFDANHALLAGRDSYQSTDGGKTWTLIQTVYWDGQFSYVDALHGWAVGGETGKVVLVTTINGGRSWVLIKPVTTR